MKIKSPLKTPSQTHLHSNIVKKKHHAQISILAQKTLVKEEGICWKLLKKVGAPLGRHMIHRQKKTAEPLLLNILGEKVLSEIKSDFFPILGHFFPPGEQKTGEALFLFILSNFVKKIPLDLPEEQRKDRIIYEIIRRLSRILLPELLRIDQASQNQIPITKESFVPISKKLIEELLGSKQKINLLSIDDICLSSAPKWLEPWLAGLISNAYCSFILEEKSEDSPLLDKGRALICASFGKDLLARESLFLNKLTGSNEFVKTVSSLVDNFTESYFGEGEKSWFEPLLKPLVFRAIRGVVGDSQLSKDEAFKKVFEYLQKWTDDTFESAIKEEDLPSYFKERSEKLFVDLFPESKELVNFAFGMLPNLVDTVGDVLLDCFKSFTGSDISSYQKRLPKELSDQVLNLARHGAEVAFATLKDSAVNGSLNALLPLFLGHEEDDRVEEFLKKEISHLLFKTFVISIEKGDALYPLLKERDPKQWVSFFFGDGNRILLSDHIPLPKYWRDPLAKYVMETAFPALFEKGLNQFYALIDQKKENQENLRKLFGGDSMSELAQVLSKRSIESARLYCKTESRQIARDVLSSLRPLIAKPPGELIEEEITDKKFDEAPFKEILELVRVKVEDLGSSNSPLLESYLESVFLKIFVSFFSRFNEKEDSLGEVLRLFLSEAKTHFEEINTIREKLKEPHAHLIPKEALESHFDQIGKLHPVLKGEKHLYYKSLAKKLFPILGLTEKEGFPASLLKFSEESLLPQILEFLVDQAKSPESFQSVVNSLLVQVKSSLANMDQAASDPVPLDQLQQDLESLSGDLLEQLVGLQPSVAKYFVRYRKFKDLSGKSSGRSLRLSVMKMSSLKLFDMLARQGLAHLSKESSPALPPLKKVDNKHELAKLIQEQAWLSLNAALLGKWNNFQAGFDAKIARLFGRRGGKVKEVLDRFFSFLSKYVFIPLIKVITFPFRILAKFIFYYYFARQAALRLQDVQSPIHQNLVLRCFDELVFTKN